MATQATPGAGDQPLHATPQGIGAFFDRWIFFGMAALFVATALMGFVPNSLNIVAEVEAGTRPALPTILHVHAVLMGSWLLLLLTQTWLMATGQRGYHMQLGVAGMVLAPAMIVAGFLLIPTMAQFNMARLAAAPAADPVALEVTRNFLRSLVSMQVAAGFMFAGFVLWAMKVRLRDPGMHKRLMILATAIPLAAGIDRISFLPTTYPFHAISPPLYVILWTTPMLAWDLLRNRQLHRAYVIWLAVFVPVAIIVELLWFDPAWMAFTGRLIGIGG